MTTDLRREPVPVPVPVPDSVPRAGDWFNPQPFRILHVCAGNVCRSALAERLMTRGLRDRLGPLAHRFQTISAGTRAVPGQPIHPDIASILHAYGADPAGFRTRRLDPDVIRDADLVLAATAVERDRAIELLPAALPRAFTLIEFARLARRVQLPPFLASDRARDGAGDGAGEGADAPAVEAGGAGDADPDVRTRARLVVAEARLMRGAAYIDPAENDIPDPAASLIRFEQCAALVARALDVVLDALCPPGVRDGR